MLVDCVCVYGIDRRKITQTIGRVAPERRCQIGRTIVAGLRLSL
jgi:hypothetical protein